MTQHILDITSERCPMAFVKARLFLDKYNDKTSVIIRYQDIPENRTLEHSITCLGHNIITTKIEMFEEKTIKILSIYVLNKNKDA